MGSLRVTVCTSVLAVVALAPSAYAADEVSVSVTPAAPAPGSDVTLRVTGCAQRTAVAASAAFVADARLTVTGARELAGESRVRSTVEPGPYAVRITCGATKQTGTLTVRDGAARRPDAAPLPVPGAGGQQPVHGEPVNGEAGQPPAHSEPVNGEAGQRPVPGQGGQQPAPEGGGQPSAPGRDGEAFPSHRPGAPASPVAPVRAGGGGAAELIAAEERGAGPGAAQGVTGLVLAGAAAAIALLRRGVRRGTG
ncbi:hypothetical protein RFN57_18145 [Streptomyces violaceochromogenes]|uniref:Uncharacterized protein n=1 Tax=Streptomyces violaceochromogenes TaxID=67377 RepID=A0ABU6LY84_9ACTN|nr:hypothetical protein [Streptomyces violaceochromogenes]MEC7054196.1 hypothetical protein [Streptomyces violaceochromogenes]GHC63596.1 hypothetical protein GCM10010309_26410 [Streptomyces violaceochromogenes]